MGKIGDMVRRVQITTPTSSKSSMGAPQKSWAHLCYMWMSRQSAGESPESYVNNRLVVAKRYKYRAHYTSSVDETMRLVDDGISYNILAVDPDPDDGLFIEILAEKVVE